MLTIFSNLLQANCDQSDCLLTGGQLGVFITNHDDDSNLISKSECDRISYNLFYFEETIQECNLMIKFYSPKTTESIVCSILTLDLIKCRKENQHLIKLKWEDDKVIEFTDPRCRYELSTRKVRTTDFFNLPFFKISSYTQLNKKLHENMGVRNLSQAREAFMNELGIDKDKVTDVAFKFRVSYTLTEPGEEKATITVETKPFGFIINREGALKLKKTFKLKKD
ncbi:hypothetical protein CDIK_2345 [Cucumispora dikerogammari]|nr:hypothetical protein CDIK_2345 [Cucumispora dikerogammari]